LHPLIDLDKVDTTRSQYSPLVNMLIPNTTNP